MIGSEPSRARTTIRDKLLMVTGVLLLGVAAVVTIVLVSNARLHSLATSVAENQIATLTDNAAVTREITALFKDIELIDRSFFSRNITWDSDESWFGLDYASALEHTDSPKLVAALQDVKLALHDYLECIAEVTGQLETRQLLSDQIWYQLDAFEADVSDWLIYATLSGERTDGIDQVLALNTAFRESMLLIEREHAHAQEIYGERRALTERAIVLDLVDDLYKRLQTLNASEPKISNHGRAIASLVMQYRDAVDVFYNLLAKQGDIYDGLADAKATTLSVTRELSEQTEQRIEQSRKEIDEIFTFTGIIAVALSMLVIIGISLVMIMMIRRHFQRPLMQMTKGIEGFADGNFSGRIRLGRADEWSSLERAFNAMAENAEVLLKDLSLEITTRERVEADLREQRRFLESILENIPSTIFVKDAKNLKYIRLNKAGEDLLGVPRDHIIGQTDSDLFDADDAEVFVAEDRKVLEETGYLDVPEELRTTISRGKIYHHTRKVRITDDAGKPVYLLGISDDISEKIESDETLRAALDSAERANRAKSEFLASMSHELRTPLNAIIGFAQVMIVEVFGKHASPKYLEYASDIERSSSHLLGIINDILDLSKIEAGQFELTPEDIELAESINECVKLVTVGDDSNAERFCVDIPDGLSSIHTDPQAFRQIMINILSNADKYTPGGGLICVSVQPSDEGATVIEVSDTGTGIAKKDLERVMEPFGQARGNVNLTHKGTGLGLSISSKLMNLQGGTLKIESEVGVGTRVILTFPGDQKTQ